MNNQDKISWYLSKGFAVEVEFENGDKIKLYAQGRSQRFIGIFNGDAGIWNEQELMGAIKVTPIPPKPYSFKVGDNVIFRDELHKINKVHGNTQYELKRIVDEKIVWYVSWYQLAPALPEEDECEVVEVTEWDACPSLRCCKNKADVPIVWIFTKPDGKKLKIKVVEKQ